MNKTLRVLIASASAAVVCHAAPFLAVGDSAEIFATGRLGIRSDDNILLASDGGRKLSDVVWEVSPGLELSFGKNAQLQGALTLVDTFVRYGDHARYNTNLFAGNFVSKYDDGKFKLGFNAGYNELNQNTVDVRGLVRRDIGSGGANAEVEVSELTAIGAGVNFTHENYHPGNYVDSDTLLVPLNFYYRWTPKLDLSLGYQYRGYEADRAVDSSDHFYNVGLRGEFSPKLTGKVAVGYTQRRFDNTFKDRSLFGVDASLAYEVTPKTALQVGVSNDFGTSPTGQQQENFVLNGLISTKITEEFSVHGGASYRGISYDSVPAAPGRAGIRARTDDYWETTIGGAYVINAHLRLVGAWIYRTYETDLAGSDFDNNVFSFAANIRY